MKMIIEKLSELLKELCSCETIYINSDLKNDLGLNSRGVVTLMIMIEDQFNIVITESDLNPFELKTVQNVVNLIEKYKVSDIDG